MVRPPLAGIAIFLLCFACNKPAEFRQIGDREILQLPKQHPILVMNFWATWCEPCVAEIPLLMRVERKHRNITLVGISMDERANEQKVRDFIKQHKMDYSIYLRRGAEDFEAMVNAIDPGWIGAIPATFVYRDGKRIFSKTGQLREGELDHILESTS